MAEYVATSRTVVSERLQYLVPGGFAPGHNYLEFDDTEGFIVAVDRLMTDSGLNAAMRQANWDYYLRWVRPDAQVLRSLERVVGGPPEAPGAPQTKIITPSQMGGPAPHVR